MEDFVYLSKILKRNEMVLSSFLYFFGLPFPLNWPIEESLRILDFVRRSLSQAISALESALSLLSAARRDGAA